MERKEPWLLYCIVKGIALRSSGSLAFFGLYTAQVLTFELCALKRKLNVHRSYLSSGLLSSFLHPRSLATPRSPSLQRPFAQHRFCLLLSTYPLFILLPLALDIPESASTLALSADSAIEAQESIGISLAQDLLSFSCVLSLSMSALPRDLTRPLGNLDWLQSVGRRHDASGEHKDANKELESDVEG